MKKILIIASSTRRNGNTDLLAQQFARGAEENGNQVEMLFLRDYTIDYCLGCWMCYNNNGDCIQKDDIKKLYPKLIEADVIVFAAPTYFYSIDGRMQTFLDRMITTYGKMRDKDFYYITASQDSNRQSLESVFETFHGFARCFSEIREKGRIYGVGADLKGDVKSTPAYKEAYEMGKTIM